MGVVFGGGVSVSVSGSFFVLRSLFPIYSYYLLSYSKASSIVLLFSLSLSMFPFFKPPCLVSVSPLVRLDGVRLALACEGFGDVGFVDCRTGNIDNIILGTK